MRLYLSSYQLGGQPERLSAMLGSNRRAAIILNATDAFGDAQRPQYLAKYAGDLEALDIIGEESIWRMNPMSHRRDTPKKSFGMAWHS